MREYEELVEYFGTPLYIYELSEIRSAFHALRSSLPKETRLYYSLKANPHVEVARELRRLGCQAEVSSTGELESALSAGFEANHCLYTGPGKTLEEITFAMRRGVTWYSVESSRDLRRVTEAASRLGVRVNVLVRVNIDKDMKGFRLPMTGVSSQFGVDGSTLIERKEEFVGAPWVIVRGFHFYAGTQIMETQDLLNSFRAALSLVRKLSEALTVDLDTVDLGGGFGHLFAVSGTRPDFSSLKVPLETMLDELLPGWKIGSPCISFESGRYLVAGCGTLLCTVQDVKESKGHVFVVLDSGINHLGGMAGLNRVPRPMPSLVSGKSSGSERIHAASLVGPLCTTLDTWAKGVDVPRVEPGDVVAVPNVGAYGLTASLIAFLGRPCPVEVTTVEGKIRQASRLAIERRPVET